MTEGTSIPKGVIIISDELLKESYFAAVNPIKDGGQKASPSQFFICNFSKQ